MALAVQPNERLKVLKNVTVEAIEKALLDGFSQCGHRNLCLFVPALEGMNWKTRSVSSHAQAYVVLGDVLFSLLTVCHNGLIPDSLLTKASCLNLVPSIDRGVE